MSHLYIDLYTIYCNEALFRDRKEFEEFVDRYIGKEGNLDIKRLYEMPECVYKTYMENQGYNFQAAAYFLMEELDIEADSLSEKDIEDYIEKNNLSKRQDAETVKLLIDHSKNYRDIIDTMEVNKFLPDKFYDYGKNAFKSFVEYYGLNRETWKQEEYSIVGDSIDTIINKEKLSIKWKTRGNWCIHLLEDRDYELYYRVIDKDGNETAAEMWKDKKKT